MPIKQDRLHHLRQRRRRRIEGASGLEQRYDLSAPLAGPFDDRLQAIRRKNLVQWHASHVGMPGQGHHAVTMSTQHVAVHVLHAHPQLHRHEGSHASRIQDPSLADHPASGQSAGLHRQVGHGIQRIGQDDEDRLRGGLQSRLHRFAHDLAVRLKQVIAAHPRFAWQASGQHHQVGAGGLAIAIAASHLHVGADHRHGFGQIQGFTLWHALHDVYQHQLGDLAFGQEMRRGRACLSCPDDGYFGHAPSFSLIRFVIGSQNPNPVTCFDCADSP